MSHTPRPATQEDVARASGYSRTLVSRALRGSPRVSEEARRVIREAATRLGYRSNAHAAALAAARTDVVGLVLPNARNPFFDLVCEELRASTAAAGLALMVTLSGPSPDVARAQAEQFLRMRVAGLMMISPSLPEAELRHLGEQTPMCLVGHLPVGGVVDAVRLDEQAAAQVVVEELGGCGRLVHVGPHHLDPTGAERRDALVAEAASAGIPWDEVRCGGDAGAMVCDYLAGAPDGIGLVTHNDVFGIDAIAAARRAGRRVAVVSYDNTFLAEREEFELTSVDQSVGELARAATGFLVERQRAAGAAGRVAVVAPRLARRGSSEL